MMEAQTFASKRSTKESILLNVMERFVSYLITRLTPSSTWTARRFAPIFFVSTGVGILAFFFEITNSTMGIDDYVYATSTLSGVAPFLIGRGSWGLLLLHAILPGPMIVPVIPMLLSIALEVLTILVLFLLWKISHQYTLSLIGAAILFVTFPYYGAEMSFSYYQVGYSLSHFLMALVLILGLLGEGWRRSLAATFCFTISLSMYQGGFSILGAGLTMTLAIYIFLHGWDSPDRRALFSRIPRFLVICLFGGGLYMLIQKIVESATGFTMLGNYHVGLDLAFWNNLAWKLKRIASLWLGMGNVIPSLPVMLFCIAFIFAIIAAFLMHTKALLYRIVTANVLLLSLISPFGIMFLHEGGLSPRASLGIGIVWAGVLLILLGSEKKTLRIVGRTYGIVSIVVFIFHMNSMFYSQHLTQKADRDMMNRIVERVYSLPGIDILKHPIPVAFVGNYQHPATPLMHPYPGTVLGFSQFFWGKGNPHRMIKLAHHIGINEISLQRGILGRGNFTEQNMRSIKGRRPWPAPDSVFIDDKHVVVWLGRAKRFDQYKLLSQIQDFFKINSGTFEPILGKNLDAYTLSQSKENKAEVIISSNGTSIPIMPSALELHLDMADRKNDHVVFSGWSVDLKNSQPPEAILFFLDGKFFFSGKTEINRRGIVKHFNNTALLRSGFKFIVPTSFFDDGSNPEVRIFALSKQGIASELRYPKRYRRGKNQDRLSVATDGKRKLSAISMLSYDTLSGFTIFRDHAARSISIGISSKEAPYYFLPHL
jgi:hypothetical protein